MPPSVKVVRRIAARGRVAHDFHQRSAAPCRSVPESTDLLDLMFNALQENAQ